MTSASSRTVEIQGQAIDLQTAGTGREILFLPAGLWLASDAQFAAELARLGRVTTLAHPGFASDKVAPHLNSADDLSYLYLDLLDEMLGKADGSAVIVAASFGGFVAAEMAVKSCRRIAALALISPAGLKTGGRHDRDYVDLFAHSEDDLVELAFANPARFRVDPKELSEEALTARMRAREALARLAWQPYMHDPKLGKRLHRIGVPALIIGGADDRIMARSCAEAYAKGIPDARFQLIARAGHLPHVEQPAPTLSAIEGFLGRLSPHSSTNRKR